MLRKLILPMLLSVALHAQTFEVATVKPAAPGSPPPGDTPRNMDTASGRFAMRNVPLRFAIEWAWDLKDYEISAPDWVRADERYDIVGKSLLPVSDDVVKVMLQALLLERFQMKVHREKRELPVYVLIPGKGPAKVKEPSPEGSTSLSATPAGTLFHKQPIARLAFLLTRRMDRPVLDLTGLTGIYDYTLNISGLGPGDNPNAPSIYTAVQDDLGLKLEARKEMIEIFVVDQVNKVPIGN